MLDKHALLFSNQWKVSKTRYIPVFPPPATITIVPLTVQKNRTGHNCLPRATHEARCGAKTGPQRFKSIIPNSAAKATPPHPRDQVRRCARRSTAALLLKEQWWLCTPRRKERLRVSLKHPLPQRAGGTSPVNPPEGEHTLLDRGEKSHLVYLV